MIQIHGSIKVCENGNVKNRLLRGLLRGHFTMTNFKAEWVAFVERFAASHLDTVPELTAQHLKIEPNADAYDAYCRQRMRNLGAAVGGAYVAPEISNMRAKELATQVQGEAVWVANAIMSDELARRVANGTMTSEDALNFARTQSRSCLNALLAPHLQMPPPPI